MHWAQKLGRFTLGGIHRPPRIHSEDCPFHT
jgi:hypothetical protein